MGQRHLFCTSPTSDADRGNFWTHPYPDPRLHQENGSSILPRDIAAVGGINPVPYFNVSLRSHDLPSSNFSSEYPNYRAANSGASYNSYLHPSSIGSSNQMPSNYVQTGPPCYNQPATGDMNSTLNPQMDYGRVPFKRKTAAISMAFDGENTSAYYGGGSSTSLSIPYAQLHPSPSSPPQYLAWDPISTPPNYRHNSMSVTGGVSQRNVRGRQSLAVQLENNPTGAPSLSNLPHHLHPARNMSAVTAATQWSHPPVCLDPQRRVFSSDVSCFSHEINQTLALSGSSNGGMEVDGQYHPSFIQSGNSVNPLPNIHGPLSRPMEVGQSSYGQRTIPSRGVSSYQLTGSAATLEDGRRPGIETAPVSRHLRPLSIMGRSTDRSRRPRSVYDRFQPFTDEDSARSRWISEGLAMIDRSSTYDPRNLFDQHRNMRLDIDNMTYEELLALGERIGNVNTGLSENAVAGCLTESVCRPPNQILDDEEKCAICLEEYKDGENVGRLTCGHDFHASCIKKWLLIKNACPICKAAALPDTLKEQ